MRTSGFKPPVAALLVLATTFIVIAAACGEDDGSSGSSSSSATDGSSTVLDNGRALTIDDLQSVGFKKSKTYDVEGLVGADSAYYGFWGLDPYKRTDYEVRFYPTHQAAVEFGTALADERIGEDARLKDDNAAWPVGLKDARQCGGDKASGPASHGIQNCAKAKYNAYFIYGNMILLCAGADQGQSTGRCEELLEQLSPPAA